jgi:hypothetical protein
MKKSELKNIIKECVKEVIFEEGVLSGIITEVAKGLQAPKLVQETAKTREARSHNSGPNREVLAAIAKDNYADVKNKFQNPELFEGTRPAPSGDGRGPLSGVDPNDSGVDLNNIPGMSSWASLAKGAR